MRWCRRSENDRVVDLIDWHRHREVDLSFVPIFGIGLVTTERTIEVVFIVFFFEEGNEVIEVKVLVLVGGIDVVLVGVVFVVGVIEIVVPNNVIEGNQVERLSLPDASLRVQ
jgi:hypothetical protein